LSEIMKRHSPFSTPLLYSTLSLALFSALCVCASNLADEKLSALLAHSFPTKSAYNCHPSFIFSLPFHAHKFASALLVLAKKEPLFSFCHLL